MKKRRIYLVSPWTILLAVIYIGAVVCIDILWFRKILDDRDIVRLFWLCAAQCVLIIPLNRLLLNLKNQIWCGKNVLYLFLKDRNQYLALPKDQIAGLLVTAEGCIRIRPEEVEDIEEFGNVCLTFQLTDGRSIRMRSGYINGKNLLNLYEELQTS